MAGTGDAAGRDGGVGPLPLQRQQHGQSDLLDHFKTRPAVPFLPLTTAPSPMCKPHPVFDIDGRKMVLAADLIATMAATELGENRTSLTSRHGDNAAALAMLFQGF